VPCRPLLDELLPEFELAELELPEPDELPEVDDLLVLDPPVLVTELCWAVVACADPARVEATPAAASTLARPAAAVTARSLDRLRFLAAIRGIRPAVPAETGPAGTGRAGLGGGGTDSGVIGCLPI
jgi:hypothetical protein